MLPTWALWEQKQRAASRPNEVWQPPSESQLYLWFFPARRALYPQCYWLLFQEQSFEYQNRNPFQALVINPSMQRDLIKGQGGTAPEREGWLCSPLFIRKSLPLGWPFSQLHRGAWSLREAVRWAARVPLQMGSQGSVPR